MAHHKSDEKIVYVGDSRVRKKSDRPVPPDYSAYPGKSEAFIPNFLLKEWMVGAVVLVGYMVLVMSEAAPLGYPADPTNTQFIPMPDWYFLFLYQLLKYPYTSEHFKVLGTLVVPGIAFGSLLLAPFLDRGPERRFYRRPIASSLMILSIMATIYLTVVSWSHYQEELKAKGIIPEHIKREEELKAGKAAPKPAGAQKAATIAIVDEGNKAFDIYKKSTCVQCHGQDLKGMPAAGIPQLRGVGDIHDETKIVDIMKNGFNKMPAGQWDASKANGLTDADLTALAKWLAAQKKQ
ncbi:c-type cytochrome [Ferviditalea candida]|uniref:C-type cytochrome n=1 Tax=Ferviditalea candida TaxID=3108399 RepID=A0ABU5ZIY0_9BACL|nr:c-type cytochrome [Paenibacillaceae bacterium T2]